MIYQFFSFACMVQAQVLEKMDNHWACRETIVLVAVKWGQQMEFIGADTMIMKWSERILSYNECG